jgi:hypothetical protein
MTDPTSPKKTALYVDFDNIYLGLRGEDTVAAEEFATSPQRWLRWLEQDMAEGDAEEPERRRILVRRCYLNPHAFGRYRGYFTRSGFSVIDCPPLTSRSKNSADIVMVMDIMDALEHQTRFDEFIIMSGDADFTPVLHRLRMHDRRIAVLVSGGVAPAYRAACDHLIREDVFIENALRVAPAVEPELFAAIAQRVHDEVACAPNQQLASADLPRILREFPAFTAGSNWLGFYSQRALTQALLQSRPELTYVDGDVSRIGLRGPLDAPGAADGAGADRTEVESLRTRIAERLRAMIANSAIPVVMASAAHALIREFGESLRSSNWLGAGTFRDFLMSFPDAGFAVAPVPIPGYLYDPRRHELPADSVPLAGVPPEIAALIGRVGQVTDAPRLSPRQYGVAFATIAAVVNASGYHLIGTGKVARDRCVEQGEQISRQSITWILGQLSSQGAFTTGQPVLAERLAAAFRTAVANLLLAADIVLDDAERALLDDWLLGGHAAKADEPSAIADERATDKDEHENETTPVEPLG